MHTNLGDLRLIMLPRLTINAHEEHILDGMFGLDQAQEFLKLDEFLLSHCIDFFDFGFGNPAISHSSVWRGDRVAV